MGGVDIGKIKWSFYEVFLKLMFTYCRTDKQQFLKTQENHVSSSKNRGRVHKNYPRPFQTQVYNNKNDAKSSARTRGYFYPGGPAIGTTMVMRPRSFAAPARTTRTKRKRRRKKNERKTISRLRGKRQAVQTPCNLR